MAGAQTKDDKQGVEVVASQAKGSPARQSMIIFGLGATPNRPVLVAL
jgi:hypothetical protein